MRKLLANTTAALAAAIALTGSPFVLTPCSANAATPMVTASPFHSLVVKSDGTVWAWGQNIFGELGDGTYINRTTPVQVKGMGGTGNLTSVISIKAGHGFSLALKSDGTIWAWGLNDRGQLGDGTTTDRTTPVQVKGSGGVGNLIGIKSIATGSYHSLALKNDGSVWAWGENLGTLGDGTYIERTTPVQVKGSGGVGNLTGIIAIAGGEWDSLALKSDGTVWAWGANTGDGTEINRTTPVQVKGVGGVGNLTGVVAITVGELHSFALKSDGTVWAWGNNNCGALGDGTYLDRTTPVQVKGAGGVGYLTGIKNIVAGNNHSLALKNDGTVWAWGENAHYNLGDGTDMDRTTPVQVKGANGVGYLTRNSGCW